MTKRKNIGAVITMIIVFGSLLFGIISTQLVRKDIRRNGIIIPAVYLIDLSKSYRGTYYQYDCFFVLNGIPKKLTKWSRARSSIQKKARVYLHYYFPGIYSKRYNKMELLMLPEDFAKYGLPYPDSLRWVDSLHRGLKK